ncbi:MAG: response regulator [Deltaproteobacteria bacterium]|nr:response regulator [Deltaproteobacteria bacterium]
MGKTIMTADDSASMRQMITFTLRQAGYDVVEAEDGKDALIKAETANIDMLITDLNMPNMNGMELIEAIRSLDKYKFIPIVMLTTESDAEKKKQGKAAGATGWLVKPFQPPQLTAVVKKVLR